MAKVDHGSIPFPGELLALGHVGFYKEIILCRNSTQM